MWDVLGLGCVAVDDLLYVDEYPPADRKVRVRRRERQCGGLTGTALVTAARLGARVAFGGVLGDDDMSRYVMENFEREGVDVSPRVFQPGARPIHSTIVIDESKLTRTIFYDLAGSVGAAVDAPSNEVIRDSRILLVDHYGVEGMTRAARIARSAGIAVVADFERDDWPGFDGLLALVDHLVISEEFACRRTGASSAADAAAALWTDARQVVAITAGKNGCSYLTKGVEVRHQPAFRVPALDPTGCGDVFHGAYCAALVQGLNVSDRLRFASAAAALKAMHRGGQAGIPTRAAVEGFLRDSTGQGSENP